MSDEDMLDTELAKGVEPSEGVSYTITGVEPTTTAVQSYKGLRVTFEPVKRAPNDNDEYAMMLWTRKQAGQFSKIGSFINGFTEFFGNEDEGRKYKKWVGHTVRLVEWKQKKRRIVVEK
jgi:hypothetical protein